MAAAKKSGICGNSFARTPIAAEQKAWVPALTYRYAYAPPAPIATKKSEAPTVDVSGIEVGKVVLHKAFGSGTIRKIEAGIIYVAFNGVEKKFQFLCAFQQGFLRKG